jgi:hypothetical protein
MDVRVPIFPKQKSLDLIEMVAITGRCRVFFPGTISTPRARLDLSSGVL